VKLSFISGDVINLSAYIVGGNPEDTYNLLVNYNQSREFELSYLDYESYVFLKTNFPTQRLYFCRASISMPIVANASVSDYKNYRTLKFTPFPFPPAGSIEPEGLEDVAYRIGHPCPPVWYPRSINEMNQSAETPAMLSVAQQDPKPNNNMAPHGCIVNISDLRAAMVEKKVIKDEFTKPINVWRYILKRALIWAGILICIVFVSWRLYVLFSDGR
jgi:hypothetical protein